MVEDVIDSSRHHEEQIRHVEGMFADGDMSVQHILQAFLLLLQFSQFLVQERVLLYQLVDFL